MTQFVIQLNAPVVTLERFSEMTGIPFGTVKDRAQRGIYPIMPKKTPQERPQINLVAFYAQCAKEANLNTDMRTK